MKIIKNKTLLVLFVCLSIVMGCSAPKEEAINASIQIAKETFNLPKMKPTETIDNYSFYLPNDFSIKSELENNIILKRGKQELILFVNPHEARDSDVLFQTLKKSNKKATLESFENDEVFGYISIAPLEGKDYELIVGIGGVKLTQKTDTKKMAESAKVMMEIVQSFEYGSKAAKK